MPKIQVILRVEFEAESSDQQTIHLALDQVLSLQPSCRVISKTISEIDGQLVHGEDPRAYSVIPGIGGSSANGICGDTYRPSYSERDGDRGRDRHHDRNSRIDSYRPTNASSSRALILHPDRSESVHPPDPSSTDDTEDAAHLGSRYNTLIDSMMFTTDPQSSRSKYKNHQIEHYSPPPASRHDRSASPRASGVLRRSVRLRAASDREIGGSAPDGDKVGRARKASFDETHVSRLQGWKERRGRGDGENDNDERLRKRNGGDRGEVEPAPSSSLEVLAPRTVAKEPAGEKSRFEKQQDRESTSPLPIPWPRCGRRTSACSFVTDANICALSGHGIAEALRLRNLRSSQKIRKARLRFDKQRWGEGDGEVKQGARLDAIIDRAYSLTLPGILPSYPDRTARHETRLLTSRLVSRDLHIRLHHPIFDHEWSDARNSQEEGRGGGAASDEPSASGDEEEEADADAETDTEERPADEEGEVELARPESEPGSESRSKPLRHGGSLHRSVASCASGTEPGERHGDGDGDEIRECSDWR